GIFTLFLNLSKIGEWNYADGKIIYYSVNEPIQDNLPSLNFPLKPTKFSISEPLPTGLSFNSVNGAISGTPTTSQAEKEYRFLASFPPIPDSPNNFSTLRMIIGEYNTTNGINIPIRMQFNFPREFTYSNYSIAPNLPTGYNFDQNTGLITAESRNTTLDMGVFKVKAARNDGVTVVGSGRFNITEWIHEAYLKAPNAEAIDNFGTAVAISSDTIVVGAIRESSNQATITNGTLTSSNNSLTDAGAAYIFKRNGTLWTNEAYLKAPNVGGSDQFGNSVSISGDTIVVGAAQESSNQTTITNGTTASADNSATAAGAAYVFRRNGATWTSEAYLKAPNANAGDQFGYSVAIDGDTIVVGARQEDSNQTTITNGTLTSSNILAGVSGAAYVFRRTGSTWSNEAYLKAPNAEANDQFGESVSISGDTIVVGAINEASNQTTITNGSTASSNNSASSSGAAYVFRRTGSTWSNEAYLKAPNAESSDQFGYSVSISGDTIVIGAINEDSNQTTITNGATASGDNTAADSGAVYVFRRTGTTWVNEAYLKAPNAEGAGGSGPDRFGDSVSIAGDTIAVGALNEDSLQATISNGLLVQTSDTANNVSVGAVYVFKRTGTTWVNEAYLKAPNPTGGAFGNGDKFGDCVSISGNTIVVGALNEDSNQTMITNGTIVTGDDSANNSGAVYVFRRK
ncbi:MAG TPA: FG-GAP repeat protein, partial [Leptospiraceae bacterium]|nr:FG-GAP repeat protein [Leptospiraceae bacterium]